MTYLPTIKETLECERDIPCRVCRDFSGCTYEFVSFLQLLIDVYGPNNQK